MSTFVNICRNYIDKKFNLNESAENKIEFFRTCLKALCSTAYLINSYSSLKEDLRIKDINAYFGFLDRNIRYAIAYVNVVGGTFSFPDLAKTLFKSKICSERAVINTVLKKKEIDGGQPIDYYLVLIHIVQTNSERFSKNG